MAEKHRVKIISSDFITHNVKQLVVEKPDGYQFKPGQACEVGINADGYRSADNPFTFTSLNNDENLEFTIKVYPEHQGITKQIGMLAVGDELIIGEPWGAIQYKKKGVFIAGGAGVTPFIAIFRQLEKDDNLRKNYLICSYKKEEDIILKNEFYKMLGDRFIVKLTGENENGPSERINQHFLEENIKDIHSQYYLCGPKKMVNDLKEMLKNAGAYYKDMITEEFID